MSRTEWDANVDADGVLRLALPMGADYAGSHVKVVVERVVDEPEISGEAWQSWVDSISGSWPTEGESTGAGESDARKV